MIEENETKYEFTIDDVKEKSILANFPNKKRVKNTDLVKNNDLIKVIPNEICLQSKL